jgi:multidrug efflux pump subunit AcrA (membrane-fusion protein)
MMKNITYCLLACLLLNCGGKKEEDKKAPVFTEKQVRAEIDKVVGIANVEPIGKILPISSEVNGTITKILVEANDEVQAGQMLMMLDYKVEENWLPNKPLSIPLRQMSRLWR